MKNKIWLPIKNFLKKVRDLLYRNFITEKLIPVKEQILLESAPDFSDNTYSLYLEMLKNNYQKKYKIIWLITNDNIEEAFHRDDISYFNTINNLSKELEESVSKDFKALIASF